MGRLAFALSLLAVSMILVARLGDPDPLRGEATALSILILLIAAMLSGIAVYRRRPRVVYN